MSRPLLLLVLLLLVYKTPGLAGRHDSSYEQNVVKPNFIFIMTDDQDLHLDSVQYQNAVLKHLVDEGTWFKKHFCTVSLCCPSRVSLLTGKAAHNTNVTDVSPPYGGYPKFVSQGLNDAYLPVWLQEAGYTTYYAGKLMNAHSTQTYNKPFPRGWNRSDFLLDPGTYRYFDGIMSLDNGPPRSIRDKYSTDVVARRSLEFLLDAVDADEPFFLGIAPIGPHANQDARGFTAPLPAWRHRNLFPDVRVPRSPSFNPATPGDLGYLKNLPRLTKDQVAYNDEFYRARLQALQPVDELVSCIFKILRRYPQVLASTYIIYTSDNGYHIGQHRLPPGKTCNIEEDINIPLIIRGPGVAAGRQVFRPTSHTDIAPTLLQLAGIPLRDDFDGLPIPVTPAALEASGPRNEHVNVEYWGRGHIEGEAYKHLKGSLANNTYKTVRVVGDDYDFMYAVWCTNEHQLYDMRADPHQLTNLFGKHGKTSSGYDISSLSARLDTLLLTLKSCKGEVCRQPWRRLFPNESVHTLDDAMRVSYDAFFHEQRNVTFTQCALGYLPAYEGALQPRIYHDGQAFMS